MKADSKLKDIITKEINSFLDKAEKVYLGMGKFKLSRKALMPKPEAPAKPQGENN